MNSRRIARVWVVMGVVAVVAVGSLLAAALARADVVHVGQVTVYSGAAVERYMVTQGGRASIAFPNTRQWVLLEEGGPYTPMPIDEVVAAIDQISYPLGELEASVIILPVPRRDVVESSAEGDVIFLSPGLGEWSREHIHYTVAHELGHIVHNALMPDSREDLWREYAGLRGLDYDAARSARDHAGRLHEVFAEDFRALFGDELARCSSGVENHELIAPDAVPGLREFFLSLPERALAGVALSTSPNPFSTSLVIKANSAGAVSSLRQVVIYDISGRAIAALDPASRGGEVVWDGADGSGRQVAPGVYFVAVRVGSTIEVRKVTRIRW
ncbi:MAG TPA: T9SS type A sorting domain-containing protein [bacterium]|nr:T9SS type A sorting domain-containing protein [bacterium]